MLKAFETISHLERFLNFKRRNSSEARVRCCAASPTRRTSAAKNGFAGYHLLAVHLTPAEERERAQVDHICAAVQRPRATQSSWHGPTGANRRESARGRKGT